MKTKLIFTAMLSVLVAIPANAQKLPKDLPVPSGQWFYLWTSDHLASVPPSVVEMDQYYRIYGSVRKTWIRRTYDYPDRETGTKVGIVYTTVQCNQNTISHEYSIDFDLNGKVLRVNPIQDPARQIYPNSNAEMIRNSICR